jgi:hypothetical protein
MVKSMQDVVISVMLQAFKYLIIINLTILRRIFFQLQGASMGA